MARNISTPDANSIKNTLLAGPTSSTSSSLTPGTDSPGLKVQKLQNVPGYKTPTFTGKDHQRQEVIRAVSSKGFMPKDLVPIEVGWFYNNLAIDDSYFQSETVEAISDHILALYGAKLQAFTRNDPESIVIELEKITDTSMVFIHTSAPGKTAYTGPGATCERRIDDRLDNSTPQEAFRLETYRSAGSISATASQQLRCYFVSKCQWVSPPVPVKPGQVTDIRSVSDKSFLERASENTIQIYQRIMTEVEKRTGPVIEYFEVEGTSERRLVMGYKMGGTSHLFSALSDLYHFYGLYSARKYVEQFSNGVTIISLYLNPLPKLAATFPHIDHSIVQITREASLLWVLPDNPFFGHGRTAHDTSITPPPVPTEGHAVQEATYAYAGWIFAQHFCNRLGPAYAALKNVLNEEDPIHADVLHAVKNRFRDETFTRQSIFEVIAAYPELIRLLYVHFAAVHYPSDEGNSLGPTLSYIRLTTEPPLSDDELYDRIRKTVSNKHELQVLECFLVFNKHILRTNFYTPTKVALSFRMSPEFLSEAEYSKRPFGIFFVIGSEFRGFHIRMRDVARGGIRIVRSRGRENYSINQRSLFDENYALAVTQDLKNKDIPEGGAKGTILPSLGADPIACFEKYIDALLDLLIEGKTAGIKGRIVDLYGRPELLFFGPDEGTAGPPMEWACLHARSRGAPWWKSLTTGKPADTLGGIPHDVYGMTSLSVRQYVVGIYKALGLVEKNVTKVQTGGPDGDLGSNEILLSSDKTITIIDGSGVAHDPAGLDRTELVRLAKARQMITHFDRSKLSPHGYIILVEEKDRTLPNGELVLDGTTFRNNAHLRYKADILVPCGGRPEAINISNVSSLLDADGKPHFKYIVEGANLFITQAARLYLEHRGVVLYKDSSANKGGVSCSSLEVLAGLALTDEEHTRLMTFPNASPSAFYSKYVQEVQARIGENASLEFSCIWKEHQRLAGTKAANARTLLSDLLSESINNLTTDLETSDLFNDEGIRRSVLSRAVPQTLLAEVPLETLVKRLPEPYQRALFSSFMASQFIYRYGINVKMVQFYQFARELSLPHSS